MNLDEERKTKESFNDEAHSRGFCLDQEWSDCENPYLDGDTHLAFDLFKSGWKAAKAQAVPKGFAVVPKTIPENVVERLKNSSYHWGENTKDYFSPIYKMMVEEAARGENE